MKAITKSKIKEIKKALSLAIKQNEPFDAQVFFKIPTPIKLDLQRYAQDTNQTVSDILRYCLQGIAVKESIADEETVRELNRIGVNLNQIARGVNRANARNKNVDLNKVAAHLASIYREISEINQSLNKR